MDSWIQSSLWFRLGPGFGDGLRPKVVLTRAVSLLCMPPVRVLLGMGLEPLLSVETTRVGTTANDFLPSELCNIHANPCEIHAKFLVQVIQDETRVMVRCAKFELLCCEIRWKFVPKLRKNGTQFVHLNND